LQDLVRLDLSNNNFSELPGSCLSVCLCLCLFGKKKQKEMKRKEI